MTRINLSSAGGWPLPRPLLRRGVKEVLREEGVEEGEVSVTFLGDEAITELNRRYLHRDYPTDVVAFTLDQPGQGVLGDVYVGFEQARRQAQEMGIPLEEELLRLTVHGVLHVLGYDHPEGKGREGSPMFLRQEELLRRVMAREKG